MTTSAPTLFHCVGARSLRVLWTLRELRGLGAGPKVGYQLVTLPFPPRSNAKEYLAINPLGTVPFFTDGDVQMTEVRRTVVFSK